MELSSYLLLKIYPKVLSSILNWHMVMLNLKLYKPGFLQALK